MGWTARNQRRSSPGNDFQEAKVRIISGRLDRMIATTKAAGNLQSTRSPPQPKRSRNAIPRDFSAKAISLLLPSAKIRASFFACRRDHTLRARDRCPPSRCDDITGHRQVSRTQNSEGRRKPQRYSFQLLIWRSAMVLREMASTNRRASWTLVNRGMAKSTAVRRMV